MNIGASRYPVLATRTRAFWRWVWRLARNRIFWLLFMMISATLTGAVISHYQELLQTVVILAAFIPMLMDTGGNCGAQASTLIIRGMAVGEIELSNWLKVVWKEFRVGILVSLVLASVNLLRIMLFVKDSNPRVDLVVTLTLFITIVFAKLIGCLLPMFAKRLHVDPALMASPMLTTIVDAFALMVYFSLAGLFLGNAASGGLAVPVVGAVAGAALGGAVDRLLNPTARLRQGMTADLHRFMAMARPQVTAYVLEAHGQLLDEVRGRIVDNYRERVEDTVKLLTAGGDGGGGRDGGGAAVDLVGSLTSEEQRRDTPWKKRPC